MSYSIHSLHLQCRSCWSILISKGMPPSRRDCRTKTLNAVERFMPSSENRASACDFNSESIRMLIFVVAIKINSFQLYYIALHIDCNTLHEKLTSMRIKQAPRSRFGNAALAVYFRRNQLLYARVLISSVTFAMNSSTSIVVVSPLRSRTERLPASASFAPRTSM